MWRWKLKNGEISIHALRGEGDRRAVVLDNFAPLFQSTPSVGRAIKRVHPLCARLRFQSTPSVGRAIAAILTSWDTSRFQSTPSVGRAIVPVRIR